MIHIVFVCLGNICRSPMAEGVMRDLITKEQLSDKVTVDSAATSRWEEGNPTHPGTKIRLAKEGISVKGMHSRPLESKDLDATYIVGMDDSNIENIETFVNGRSTGTISKLLAFAGRNDDIADPYFTEDFDTAYADVYEGCQALMTLIKEELK